MKAHNFNKPCPTIYLFIYFWADRAKDKSQGTTKPVNKANSAAAKVTTSNGNGALNR